MEAGQRHSMRHDGGLTVTASMPNCRTLRPRDGDITLCRGCFDSRGCRCLDGKTTSRCGTTPVAGNHWVMRWANDGLSSAPETNRLRSAESSNQDAAADTHTIATRTSSAKHKAESLTMSVCASTPNISKSSGGKPEAASLDLHGLKRTIDDIVRWALFSNPLAQNRGSNTVVRDDSEGEVGLSRLRPWPPGRHNYQRMPPIPVRHNPACPQASNADSDQHRCSASVRTQSQSTDKA